MLELQTQESEKIRGRWISRNRVRASKARLFDDFETPPYFDHVERWKDQDGNLICTSQPYGEVDPEVLAKWAEENGVTATISADSWWYPGSTLLIVWRVK